MPLTSGHDLHEREIEELRQREACYRASLARHSALADSAETLHEIARLNDPRVRKLRCANGSSDPAGVAVPPSAPPARVPATPQRPNELRILVVDDMISIRKLLTLCLQQADYQVAEAADVASASQLLSAQQIQLLIVDANLPDGSGVVLARSARRVQPDLKVLLISGAAESDHDFDAALLKPFRMEELLNVVRSLLPLPAASGH